MFEWIRSIANPNGRSYPKSNRRPRRPNDFRPRLEVLEDRLAPATVSMYWDPTVGKTGNKSCTWDYNPMNPLGSLWFQNGWTQTVTFQAGMGLTVSDASNVGTQSTPNLTSNGGAVAAITLTNYSLFNVESNSTLSLTGPSGGGAVFFAGDTKAGERLYNGGTVTYTGHLSATDYIKVPVENTGVFNVNAGGGSSTGATLQVSGTDTNTNNVSFYQNSSSARTNISGKGTLWCTNNFTMTAGSLWTTDAYTETLKVGTGGSSPVDGTVTLTGGTVNIDTAKTNVYGTLRIWGTTDSNIPILNAGSVVINFNADITVGSNKCSTLMVGDSTGTANFGYNGGATSVSLHIQSDPTTKHQWQIIFFGSKNGGVTNEPSGPDWTQTWNDNNLQINYK